MTTTIEVENRSKYNELSLIEYQRIDCELTLGHTTTTKRIGFHVRDGM